MRRTFNYIITNVIKDIFVDVNKCGISILQISYSENLLILEGSSFGFDFIKI